MERRYEQQLERMLAQAEVSPELTEGYLVTGSLTAAL